ncbi:MAG: ATP-binding protein [Azoarcus sp.]|nr:ATP-binding protein [Azoarcus sp.]
MIKRQAEVQLKRLAEQFPVVTLLGPRQSGKTTLAKSTFPNHEYINLEFPPIRKAAMDDAVGFFKAHPGPLILDEIQRIPELLSYIQVMADENKQKGKFILTGSHQPRLAEGIAQSLAGRTGILTLLPCSISELDSASILLDRNHSIYHGYMPSIHFDGIEPTAFYRAYFQTYVERDVKMLMNISNQNSFETFVRLLAGRVGQILNLNSLAGDVGISHTTLSSWLSVLEASFIIFRLPSYFNNFGKRLIKAPKVFFYEVGLAAWLLGIETPAQVGRDPLLGGLFENMVIVEALKARLNAGKLPNLYFFRDQRGMEVDLLVLRGKNLLPIEIKSGMTYDRSFAKNLLSLCKATDTAQSPTVIYAGEQRVIADGTAFCNFRDTEKIITGWDSEHAAA